MLNYSWRDGNRLGAWRLLELFEALDFPAGLITNSAIVDYCPELLHADRHRLTTELIAHGRSNSEFQDDFDEAGEAALIAEVRGRLGETPSGWLGPWIAQSRVTPDLLDEAEFTYHLDWCHDDQPTWMQTCDRSSTILSVPYPQEINDTPSIVAHHIDHREFVARIVDQFDEILEQSARQPLAMGIAVHPYIMGQPFRLRALRQALNHIVANRNRIWLTTPSLIARHYSARFPA